MSRSFVEIRLFEKRFIEKTGQPRVRGEFHAKTAQYILVVEEVERRRAIVCEGLYRVNGNVKEQNMMIQKIKEAKHSLRLRRQILATQCKDHNTLCSIMKFYLREGEPLLTYKLLQCVQKF